MLQHLDAWDLPSEVTPPKKVSFPKILKVQHTDLIVH